MWKFLETYQAENLHFTLSFSPLKFAIAKWLQIKSRSKVQFGIEMGDECKIELAGRIIRKSIYRRRASLLCIMLVCCNSKHERVSMREQKLSDSRNAAIATFDEEMPTDHMQIIVASLCFIDARWQTGFESCRCFGCLAVFRLALIGIPAHGMFNVCSRKY